MCADRRTQKDCRHTYVHLQPYYDLDYTNSMRTSIAASPLRGPTLTILV